MLNLVSTTSWQQTRKTWKRFAIWNVDLFRVSSLSFLSYTRDQESQAKICKKQTYYQPFLKWCSFLSPTKWLKRVLHFAATKARFFFPVRPVGQACGSDAFLKPKSKWNHSNIFKPCYPAWSTIYFHEPATQLGNPPKDALSFLQEFKHFGGKVQPFWETLMTSLYAGWYIGSLILAYYCPIVIPM